MSRNLDETNGPVAVFERALTKIEAGLESAGRPRAFKDRKLATSFRADLFRLEAWARLHLAWPEPTEQEKIQKIFDKTKELEDALGRLDLERTILEEAEKAGIPKLIDAAFEDVASARKALKRILRDGKWLPRKSQDKPHNKAHNRPTKFRHKLAEIRWPSSDEHLHWIVGEVSRAITDLRAKYKKSLKPVLLTKKYDERIVEDAVHEWRRQLRWIPIYFQTADGIFALKEAPLIVSPAENKLIKQYAQSPFAQLPVRETTFVQVHSVPFYELTREIDVLGHLKDEGEFYFILLERMKRAGVDEDEAFSIVERQYGNVPKKLPPKVHALLREHDERSPLSLIQKDLMKALKG